MRKAALLSLAVALATLASCSGSSDGGMMAETPEPPGTFQVGSSASADYASIQQAIDASGPGSTIMIEMGTYTEKLFIDKSLILIGAGLGTIVEYPSGGVVDAAVIEIRDAVTVRIEALSVTSLQASTDGVRVRGSTAVVLESIVASHIPADGIDVRDSRGVDILMATVESNGSDGIQVDLGSGNVKIRSCVATSNGSDGIKVRNAADVIVEDSTSSFNGDDGVLVRDSSGVQLIGNEMLQNIGWGITVTDSPDTILEDNVASANGAGNIKCSPDPCP